MKQGSFIRLGLCIVAGAVGLTGCLHEERTGVIVLNCDSDPVTPLPINFSATGYWNLNDDIRGAFPTIDSVSLARHYCKYGADQERDFGETPLYSSSSKPSSSSISSSSSKPSSSSVSSSSSKPSSSSISSSSSKPSSSSISSSSSKPSSSSVSSSSSKPSSSSVSSSSSKPSSSSVSSSSSKPSSSSSVDSGCNREKVESAEFPDKILFKFEPNALYDGDPARPALNGWTDGGSTYINTTYGAGTWVVPTGADCDQRVKIVGFPDTYNTIIETVWIGELIEETEVDRVWPKGAETW